MDQRVEENIAGQTNAAGYAMYLTPSDFWATLIPCGELATMHFGIGSSGRGGYFLPKCDSILQYQAICSGWLPNHCFQFPFGDQQDIEDWYDVTKLGSLRLRLKSGTGTSGNVDTILQQVRMY